MNNNSTSSATNTAILDAATDITDVLDKSKCCCLNESSRSDYLGIFEEGEGSNLKSGTDPQLLIQLSFRQTVKLTHIEFVTEKNKSCPKLIKFFPNRTNMGFDEAMEESPGETTRLYSMSGRTKVKLNKVPLWCLTNDLTIFVQDNYGEPYTEIKKIKVYGEIIDDTDVSQIRRGFCC